MKRILLLAAALTISLAISVSAQNNCRQLKANFVLNWDPAASAGTGPVTNGGILFGTLEEVSNLGAGLVWTPDANVAAVLSDVTITTHRGQLKTSVVVATSVVSPFAYTEFGHIDPNTSTGEFAGATGVIFILGKSLVDANGPFTGEITGEICFAP